MLLGAYGATDPAVEELIRNNVRTLQAVQARLWDAHSSWRNGRLLSGALLAPLLLRIGAYDWSEAVGAWQESLDNWWGEKLTSAVRAAPYELGTDGVRRVDAWIHMGQKLIPWAEDIAKRMGDDTLANDVRRFGGSFRTAVGMAVGGAGAVITTALKALPWWAQLGLGVLVAAKIYSVARK